MSLFVLLTPSASFAWSINPFCLDHDNQREGKQYSIDELSSQVLLFQASGLSPLNDMTHRAERLGARETKFW
jgi:hypothetical protein